MSPTWFPPRKVLASCIVCASLPFIRGFKLSLSQALYWQYSQYFIFILTNLPLDSLHHIAVDLMVQDHQTTAVIMLLQLNRNVEYIKTTQSGRHLHDLVGDDILRMLLLHTCIFLPIFFILSSSFSDFSSSKPNSPSSFRGNYLQLTGPPITTTINATTRVTTTRQC
jgi:hypothetical protein